jgi:hypothetical protein
MTPEIEAGRNGPEGASAGPKTMPCGHTIDDYDIVVLGGPGGVIECMRCGHTIGTPPSNMVHWTHGKPFPCGHTIADFDPATRTTPGATTRCKCGYETRVPTLDPPGPPR